MAGIYSLTLGIEAPVRVAAATVQSLIGSITALVEACIDAVAFIVQPTVDAIALAIEVPGKIIPAGLRGAL